VAALLTFRKIYIVRKRDGKHRQQAPASTSKFLPETELQRQQLLRLLLQQQETPKGNMSPEGGNEQTYKLDWPANQDCNSHRVNTNSMRANPFTRHSRGSLYNRSVNGAGGVGTPYNPAVNGGAGAGALHSFPVGGGETRAISQTLAENMMVGADRGVPDIIVEEPTSPGTVVSPLESVVYTPPMAQREDDLADISGIVNTRSPRYTQVAPVDSTSRPPLQDNGYPAEKPVVYAIPQEHLPQRPLNGYTVVDATEALHASNHDRHSRRTEIELAGRGRDSTGRSRQELEEVEVVGSIRRVETDGWARRF